jgi:uncharacterized protein (DUF486 family)
VLFLTSCLLIITSHMFITIYHLNTVKKDCVSWCFVKVQSHAVCFSVTTLALPPGTEFIHCWVVCIFHWGCMGQM